MWDTLAKGGEHFEGDMKHITKQGNDFWSMATYTCVKRADESVDKILFLGIDNTKEKRKTLISQSQVEAIDSSIIKAEYMLDGSLLEWNERYMDSLGYTKDEEIRGKSIYDFIYDEDHERAKDIWKNILTGEPFEGQIRMDTNKGEKWFHATLSPVKDLYGEIERVVYIGVDITRQKHIERESKMGKLKYEKTLEGTLDAVIIIDEAETITFFNKAAEQLWEFKKSEVIGKSIRDLLPSEYTNDPQFFDNHVLKGVNVRKDIKIMNAKNERIPVYIMFAEARIGDLITYTVFIQKIELDNF